MDFESAVDLSRQIEQNFRPPLLVVGFRRQREEDPDSWAIDLLESSTRQLVTSTRRPTGTAVSRATSPARATARRTHRRALSRPFSRCTISASRASISSMIRRASTSPASSQSSL